MVNVAETHGDYFAESVGRDAVRYHILYKYAASHETFTKVWLVDTRAWIQNSNIYSNIAN